MVALVFSSSLVFSQNQRNGNGSNAQLLAPDGTPLTEKKYTPPIEKQITNTPPVNTDLLAPDGTPLKMKKVVPIEKVNNDVMPVNTEGLNPDGTPIGSQQVAVFTETPQQPVIETYVRKAGTANLDVANNVQETYIRKSNQDIAPFDNSREKYVRDASIQEPRSASVSKLQSSDKTVSGTVETNQDLLTAPTVTAAPVSATLKKSEVTVSGSVETNKDLLAAPKVTPTAPAANLKSSSNTAAGLEEKTK